MSNGDDLNDDLDYNFDNIESDNDGSFVDEEFMAPNDSEETLEVATGKKRERDDAEPQQQTQQKKKKSKKTKQWFSQVPDIAKSSESSQYDFLVDQLKSAYSKLSDIELEEKLIPGEWVYNSR